MGESKKSKKTIWIYAVVLFTSAFIVLLLTAYSQIKFNKNIDEYRNQLSSREKENMNFQMNLNTALEENKKIKVEIDDLKKTIMQSKDKEEDYKKEIEQYKNDKEKMLKAYEALITANSQYEKGNIIESAMILKKQCDINLLEKEAQENYKALLDKTIKKASYKLYIEGYSKYKTKKYSEAIEKLQQSYDLTSDEYFSDDCLYIIALAQNNSGNKEAAKNTANSLLEKYPSSSYNKDLASLLK